MKNNKWVFGAPYIINECKEDQLPLVACIIRWVEWDGTCGFMSPENQSIVEVFPESIGQFTGLIDINGINIFEGDILKSGTANLCLSRVYFNESELTFYRHSFLENSSYYFPLFKNFDIHKFKIIGNVHDNIELISKQNRKEII